MSHLGIYEGVYAELRDGRISKVTRANGGWKIDVGSDTPAGITHLYYSGKEYPGGDPESPRDIIRVLTPAEVSKRTGKHPFAKPEDVQATIPPHVLSAAMDAGIKADPAYEQFVNAILKAGIAAMGDRDVPMGEKDPIDMDALCEEISSGLNGNKGFLERPEAAQQHIRNAAERVVKHLSDKQIPKNESENRIQDSEKARGGLSEFRIAPDLIAIALDEAERKFSQTTLKKQDIRSMRIKAVHDLIRSEAAKQIEHLQVPLSKPLEGITIVFTGATEMDRSTLKGIAESLGAKVSGSVHKDTSLVVYGPGSASKFDKAVELGIPMMCEKAWSRLACLFNYGKPQPVLPKAMIEHMQEQYDLSEPDIAFTFDGHPINKLHPVTAAFLKAIYPAAPLRGVKFGQGGLLATYGRPLSVAEITVSVSAPGGIPTWINDATTDESGQSSGFTASDTASIPSPAEIERVIADCVKKWRETHGDIGGIPPRQFIANAVYDFLYKRAK